MSNEQQRLWESIKPMYQCKLCGKSFEKPQQLGAHMVSCYKKQEAEHVAEV